MFLKHRNLIAWILLLAAAVSWVYGQRMITNGNHSVTVTEATAFPQATEETTFPTTDTVPPGTDWTETTEPGASPQPYKRPGKTAGVLLSFLTAVLFGMAVFFLKQKAPILGPDAAAMLIAATNWYLYNWANADYLYFYGSTEAFAMTGFRVVAVFLLQISLREYWGWFTSKTPLTWCLVSRLAKRSVRPQISLLIFVGWILACLGLVLLAIQMWLLMSAVFSALAALFGIACLWQYGSDLNHFKIQLNNFEAGQAITIKDGAFSATEQQLLEVQAQHEEAIKTAVTSERFRVELISNVSHDLRTPLTSILGYGELLEKESLSPEGKEQLTRLNQKAGYMRDLVESLFELTKVSSGASESKKDKIDMIRLLEQTIGLFDDQLNAAGLMVRRHYASNSVSVVTDGARMHQVFANLLTNAIKYAMPGTRIHLDVTEQDSGVRVRMVNTASYEMDFTPEEIVQRFARGDKARSTKGSGLGLAIAQTYTESVGGNFRVAIDGDQFSAIVELPKS